MGLINNPGRRYRRFRNENRYDKPILIFAIDTFLSLAELLLIFVVVVTISIATYSWFNKPNEPERVAQRDKVQSVSKATQSPNDRATNSPIVQANAKKGIVKKVEPALDFKQSKGFEADTKALHPSHNVTTTQDGLDNDTKISKFLDDSWILNLNPSQYVIQYDASTNLRSLETSTPAIQYGDQIGIFQYDETLSGRPVYGIAGGVYNSYDEAMTVLEGLPEIAESYDPWVRKAGDVVSQIVSLKKKSQAE